MPILVPRVVGSGRARPTGRVAFNPAHPQAQGLAFWLALNTPSMRHVENQVQPGVAVSPTWGMANGPYGPEADISSDPYTFYTRREGVVTGVTVAAWLRPSWGYFGGFLEEICWFAAGSGSTATRFNHQTDNSTYDWFFLSDEAGGVTVLTPPVSYSSGDLIHVVLTHVGDGTTTGYGLFNGANSTLPIATTTAMTRPMTLVGVASDSSGTSTFAGQLLDLRIYTRPLSRAEALALWDPSSRWDLYQSTPRLWIPGVDVSSGTVHTLSVSGAVTPTGALVRSTGKAVTGGLTPAGALRRQGQKLWVGGLTPAGVLLRQAQKPLTGTLTPTSALARAIAKTWTGALTPAGALAKQAQKPLAGALTPAGTLATVRSYVRTFTGSLAPNGALARATSRTMAGSLTPTGAVRKSTSKTVVGALTPSGVVSVLRAYTRTFTGALTPSGVLRRQAQKVLTGSVTPSGTLRRLVQKVLAGQLVPAGVMTYIPPGGGGSGSNLQPYITVYFWKRTG